MGCFLVLLLCDFFSLERDILSLFDPHVHVRPNLEDLCDEDDSDVSEEAVVELMMVVVPMLGSVWEELLDEPDRRRARRKLSRMAMVVEVESELYAE